MLKATLLRNQVKAKFSGNLLLSLKYSSEGYNSKDVGQTSKSNFLQSQTEDYPAIEQLPLPLNIEDLPSSERLKFSPQRNRDINGSYMSSSTPSFMDFPSGKRIPTDVRIECYDCCGTINLNSAMQTNVPFPFSSRGKPVHLNMPGGQWRQNEKYVSEDLNNVHHTNTRKLCSRHGTSLPLDTSHRTGSKNFCIYSPNRDLNFSSSLQFSFSNLNSTQFRTFCADKKKVETVQENVDTKKGYWFSSTQKFKNLIKEYGPTAFVLHIVISCTSLLIIYAVVTVISSSGDASSIIKTFGGSEGAVTAGTTAHFVIAFAIHKMLAPVRISITLVATPFVAKKLRKLGILKSKKQ